MDSGDLPKLVRSCNKFKYSETSSKSHLLSTTKFTKPRAESQFMLLQCLKIARELFLVHSLRDSVDFSKDLQDENELFLTENDNKYRATYHELTEHYNGLIKERIVYVPSFAKAVIQYFGPKMTSPDFTLFSRFVFPSFFGYFLSHELTPIAAEIISYLLQLDSTFASHFLFPFYLSAFHFLYHLFYTFNLQMNYGYNVPSIYTLKNELLKIIDDSLPYFTPSHSLVMVDFLDYSDESGRQFTDFFKYQYLLYFFTLLSKKKTTRISIDDFKLVFDQISHEELHLLLHGKKIPATVNALTQPQFGTFYNTSNDISKTAYSLFILISPREISVLNKFADIESIIIEPLLLSKQSPDNPKKINKPNLIVTNLNKNDFLPQFIQVGIPNFDEHQSNQQVIHLESVECSNEVKYYAQKWIGQGIDLDRISAKFDSGDTLELRRAKQVVKEKPGMAEEVAKFNQSILSLNIAVNEFDQKRALMEIYQFYNQFKETFSPTTDRPPLGVLEPANIKYNIMNNFVDYDTSYVDARMNVINALAMRVRDIEVMTADEAMYELTRVLKITNQLVDNSPKGQLCFLPMVAMIAEKAQKMRFYQLMTEINGRVKALSPLWEELEQQINIDAGDNPCFYWQQAGYNDITSTLRPSISFTHLG